MSIPIASRIDDEGEKVAERGMFQGELLAVGEVKDGRAWVAIGLLVGEKRAQRGLIERHQGPQATNSDGSIGALVRADHNGLPAPFR